MGEYNYDTEPVLFASLPNVNWVPGWDFLITDDDYILKDSGFAPIENKFNLRPHAYAPSLNAVAYHRPKSEVHVREEAVFLSGPPDGHFGHWLVDFLPRLRAREHTSCMKVVIPSYLWGKHAECLRDFGVRESDIIVCARENL
ncbi:MAG: hypothetical protein RLN85_05030, partial [Pseudomonadales bacterium]